MKVSFQGIGECVATYYNSGTAPAASGDPVKISGSGEVAKCAAGERFFGAALNADGDFVSVRIKGHVTLPYSGAAPGLGYVKLSADGSGGVKADTAGAEYAVICVDTADKSLVIML